MKKILKQIPLILSCLMIFAIIGATAYAFSAVSSLSAPEIQRVMEKKYSSIYDRSGRKIETLGENKKTYVEYEDLPPLLIEALLSVEDNEFFYHEGINYKRIFSSLFNNILTSTRQGGSTITQQLVKNLLLSNEQSLKRKIQEAYLATLLEQNMSKEQILEYYFNEIYFESSVPGIGYAAKRFFDKDVSHLNLPECALLVGLVKSPPQYNPYNHPDRAEERKNLVLQTMLDNNRITAEQYRSSVEKSVEELVLPKGMNYEEETYDFQAYLDIVYSEVEALTGYNPFTVAMEIDTYLDTSVQSFLDKIQKGEIFAFEDQEQQIASSVIDNETGGIIGVIGGRNYDGMMLYNRAYAMRRQPASTMKPIFTYALAAEYLNFNEYTPVEDKAYTYPGTDITVQNADKNYLGTIPLVDAIGFSRNTSTLYTLEKVIGKIGQEACVNYLKSIGLMDEGPFTYPYAIGGMKYGISPTQLAGAYAMLARGGDYILPSTIASVRLVETGETIYRRNQNGTRVLSKESAYIMTSTLKKVMDANYYNIAYTRPENTIIAGKTGTNAYDDNVIARYGYPSYADRDVWFCGYSKNYTIACWTGFDEPKENQKTYFGKGDTRRLIAKDIFRSCLSRLELPQQPFDRPDSITEVPIVRGIPGNYLPNELVPSSMIVKASFKKGEEPKNTLPLPQFEPLKDISIIATDTTLNIDIPLELKEDDLYRYIFGKRVFMVTYEDESELKTHLYDCSHFSIENPKKNFTLSIVETYENNTKITGEPYVFSLVNPERFW